MQYLVVGAMLRPGVSAAYEVSRGALGCPGLGHSVLYAVF